MQKRLSWFLKSWEADMTTICSGSLDNGTSTTWSGWVNSGVTITGGTSASTWYIWNNNSTYTTSADTVWITWNTEGTEQYNYSPTYNTPKLTEAQEEEYRVAELNRKKEEEERLIKEKAKEEKARELLREVLTDEQDEQLEKKGYFELVSVNSGNRYRINKGRSRNVELLDSDGKSIKRLCFHPEALVHNYDTMVAQKLMLENDEEEVKKVANYS